MTSSHVLYKFCSFLSHSFSMLSPSFIIHSHTFLFFHLFYFLSFSHFSPFHLHFPYLSCCLSHHCMRSAFISSYLSPHFPSFFRFSYLTPSCISFVPFSLPVSSTRKLISSSSFHRLDMTLAVAEALNPNKPINETLFAVPTFLLPFAFCFFLFESLFHLFSFSLFHVSSSSLFPRSLIFALFSFLSFLLPFSFFFLCRF